MDVVDHFSFGASFSGCQIRAHCADVIRWMEHHTCTWRRWSRRRRQRRLSFPNGDIALLTCCSYQLSVRQHLVRACIALQLLLEGQLLLIYQRRSSSQLSSNCQTKAPFRPDRLALRLCRSFNIIVTLQYVSVTHQCSIPVHLLLRARIPINQPINQPIKQSINHLIDPSITIDGYSRPDFINSYVIEQKFISHQTKIVYIKQISQCFHSLMLMSLPMY